MRIQAILRSTRRRRYLAKKNVNGNGNGNQAIEVDWAEVEPDEVFRRLPVQEVRRVEQKMRTDALNKQSELRSMVGYVSHDCVELC